jgi:glycosyltransferase involved in cell wall biosynthesis
VKILQVLGGGAWGGGSVVILSLVRALIERGDEVWLMCFDDETEQHFRDAGAIPVRVTQWKRPITPHDLVPMTELYRLCRCERFDMVATHTSKGGFIGRIAARAAGVPRIVHHVHGFAFNQDTGPLVRGIYVTLERLAGMACDHLITVNEVCRRVAIESGIAAPRKVTAVLNGIDVTRFEGIDRAAARERFGFRADERIVVCTGRLMPLKGFDYAIGALRGLQNVRMVLAGEGPYEAELRRQARDAGVENSVVFPGFRRDVPELLAACDVYLQPSLIEGLSIALMEAMASGCATIATDIWGNAEMIEDGVTGWLVKPRSAEAIHNAMVECFVDPMKAAERGRQAREKAARLYTWQRMVKECIAVYDSVEPSRAPRAARHWVDDHA